MVSAGCTLLASVTVMISVVIPTRNRVSRLETAIASALGQTWRDLEVIVVDDASDDSTAALLEGLRASDPRLRVTRHPERRGAGSARNTGARHARGQALAFLDDDSAWAPHKLEVQHRRLTSESGVVYCRHAVRQPDGAWAVEGAAGAEKAPLESLLRTNYIGTSTLLIRRDVFEVAGGFDVTLPRLQDWELLLRLARATRFAFVPDVLVRSPLLEGGISMDTAALPRAAARIVERNRESLTPRQLGSLHYGLGKFLLADGHTRHARAFFRQALLLAPGAPVHWIGLLASALGPRVARSVRSWRRRRRAAAAGGDWQWEDAERSAKRVVRE